jgi:hypothetical protein
MKTLFILIALFSINVIYSQEYQVKYIHKMYDNKINFYGIFLKFKIKFTEDEKFLLTTYSNSTIKKGKEIIYHCQFYAPLSVVAHTNTHRQLKYCPRVIARQPLENHKIKKMQGDSILLYKEIYMEYFDVLPEEKIDSVTITFHNYKYTIDSGFFK